MENIAPVCHDGKGWQRCFTPAERHSRPDLFKLFGVPRWQSRLMGHYTSDSGVLTAASSIFIIYAHWFSKKKERKSLQKFWHFTVVKPHEMLMWWLIRVSFHSGVPVMDNNWNIPIHNMDVDGV